MIIDRTIFDEPHCQSLEILAAQALAEDDAAAAFRLADRRCRIQPAPEPHCYVLRAEALYRLGAKTAAITDLVKAIEIVPGNIAANRRMLAWAGSKQQMRAALAIVHHDSNPDMLRNALEVLRKHGQRNFTNVLVLEDAIEGWAVWQGEAFLEISIVDPAVRIHEKFEADAFHPLGEHGHATNFRIRRPKSTHPQLVTLATADGVFHTVRVAANDCAPKTRIILPRSQNSHPQQVTVIVPIYGGYETTRICIDSLRTDLKACGHRAILVNDATPDRRIARYLAKCETDSSIEVMVNGRNLGFIGSVNSALERIKQGDILILNSDTIVPRGFIDRLADAARSSPDIGTVTPLSNNGEFVSFPIPNRANPVGSRNEIERLDTVSAKTNSGKIIDIPSGIGFCLYITRACLDEVGALSEDFGRGYLEDVDFCLRARERGFRSVCAPSVYVGHVGSKSFRQEKRSLVVRNLRVLEQRFPGHRAECAAFIEADPLRSAREAIERTAAPTMLRSRMFVTGPGIISAIARQRAREVTSATKVTMVMEVRILADGVVVTLVNAQGGIPQSLQFKLCSSSDCQLFADFLTGNEISRIEFLDPANTPLELVDLLLKLKLPYDMYIADAGLLGRKEKLVAAAAQFVPPHRKDKQNEVALQTAAACDSRIDRWPQIADGAERIIVPNLQAEVFVRSALSPRVAGKIIREDETCGRPATWKRNRHAAGHLGLVPVRSGAHEQRLMSEVARRLKKIKSEISITVIGETLDDIGLMRSSSAFVTGAVEPHDFGDLVRSLAVDHLFVSATQPLFAHPILSAATSCHLPTAYFDWSAGKCTARKSDLAIDPQWPLAELVDKLSGWLSDRCHAS